MISAWHRECSKDAINFRIPIIVIEPKLFNSTVWILNESQRPHVKILVASCVAIERLQNV
jgi:hypothetical protein